MNKIKLLIFIIASLAILLQSNTVLAEEAASVLYCPEKIECTKDKSVSSCKIIGQYSEWGNIEAWSTIRKGVHALTSVQSSYQKPLWWREPYTICYYSNIDYSGSMLSVEPIHNKIPRLSQWESTSNNTTNWQTGGYSAYCHSDDTPLDPRACPLELVPSIEIESHAYFSSKLSVYANGILLNKNNENWYISDFYYQIINMYQAWDACSDTGLCTIELMATINEALVDVGSIVVDMDNKMKIVYVHAITGFEISQNNQMNSIEIKPAS